MNLIRRTSNPLFPSLLDEFFGSDMPFSALSNRSHVPSVNISETDTNFELALAAPGKTRKDFNVELDDHVLTVSSESKHEDESKMDQYTRREYRYDNFQRSFRLPETVDTAGIKAKYDNGILTISLPKHEEAIPEPKKQIEIK
ncbi:MAG: molecular chaperone Hsp20 [Flavobacteriaceae bacterium]|nr:molecular chaperone Hsp20 [Flavobacteriaceae bacterium]|tara:strand:- start:170 stop:598 length:429 start_codon:yes stop_codon:yes gene_type:complete